MIQKFVKNEKTFENGGNNQTIELDERMLDDETFHRVEKEKLLAIKGIDDERLDDLNLNDFSREKLRLGNETPQKEDLFSTGNNMLQLHKIESANARANKFKTAANNLSSSPSKLSANNSGDKKPFNKSQK